MNETDRKSGRKQEVSWLLLLTVTGVIVATLSLQYRNVFYTEGEVLQRLFALLTGFVACCVLTGFRHRTIALWCVTSLGGGCLLLWQSYQNRKWATIHEDIISIVPFAEELKNETGHYPASLDGYAFKNAGVKSHIYGFVSDETNEFCVTYFMNDPGISYWYSSKSGFGYYPD